MAIDKVSLMTGIATTVGAAAILYGSSVAYTFMSEQIVTVAELSEAVEPLRKQQQRQADSLRSIQISALRKVIRDIKIDMRELERYEADWTDSDKQLYNLLEDDLLTAQKELDGLL
jgi:hypothetical protein